MTPEERLEELERGENPRLILRLPSGFAVMAENQYLQGYSLLLATPMVGQFLDLDEFQRHQFLTDMGCLGEAVKNATGAARINFAIYGNVDPFLHAHVWPRFEDEPSERRTLPPLVMDESFRSNPATVWSGEQHSLVLALIRRELERTL